MPTARALSVCCFLGACLINFPGSRAAEPAVSIRSDFPGGNILVSSTEHSRVYLAPDLRTTRTPWFYWYFEAEVSTPGRVTFIFDRAKIGVRGPAVSTDNGKTWKWLGRESVTYAQPKTADSPGSPEESFAYDFTEANQKVRFSVGFPYVQANLDEFLQANAANPNFKQSELATTLGGLPVELIQIGEPGADKVSMLVTARSHACEALASYILEGFMAEALSDSAAGEAFRKKFVLYAVPILDKDGVQAGDQGKNREPHDHNRDYGTTNLYPEIKAVQDLGAEKQVRVAIDFHCPALRGDIHETFHWLGLKIPHISDNADELSSWILQERPVAHNAPLNFLVQPPDPPKLDNIPSSWYFGQNGARFAITLESPYAQMPDIETARAYGRAVLRGLVRTQLIAEGETRTAYDFAAFDKQQKLILSLGGQPEKVEEMAAGILNDPAAPAPFRALAQLGRANMLKRGKHYAEALAAAREAKDNPGATHLQKLNALASIVSIQTLNPDASPDDVLAALREFEAHPYWGRDTGYGPYAEVSRYFEKKGDLKDALIYAEKQVTSSADWQKSGSMLRVAGLLDALDQKDAAVAKRWEVVALLQPFMLPQPKGKSIMLGVQTGDYFEALTGIPSAALEEKIEAAKIILNYPTLPAGLREKARDWLEQNAPQA